MHRFFSLPLALAAFFALAASAAAQKVELLDFTSDSCPACRKMEPVLQGLTASGAPVRRVDVSRERDLAARFQIQYLPTFVAVADGREISRQVGPTSPDRLREMLQQASAAAQRRETRDKRQEPESLAQGSSSGLGPPLSTLDSKLIASSVRLRVEDPQGVSYGTGTIISARPTTEGRSGEAVVITCGHLFRESRGKLPVQVELFEADARARSGSGHTLSGVADVAQGEVIGYDLTRDLGLVRIRVDRPVSTSPLAPRDAALQPGDKAASVGCDHGQEPTVWHTRLTAINRYVGPANVEAARAPVQGRSGGGLFNDRGELIGVCFAADDQGNEGLYVGVPAIYDQLDQLQLTSIATRPGPAAVARNQPSPADRGTGFPTRPPTGRGTRLETPPTEAGIEAASELVPVASSGTALASTESSALTTEERAALEEIGQRSRGGEVIVIIRPKSPGDRCEILSLENPSEEFIGQLTSLGEKATQARFTAQKHRQQTTAPDDRSTSQRVVQRARTELRGRATQWSPVSPKK